MQMDKLYVPESDQKKTPEKLAIQTSCNVVDQDLFYIKFTLRFHNSL